MAAGVTSAQLLSAAALSLMPSHNSQFEAVPPSDDVLALLNSSLSPFWGSDAENEFYLFSLNASNLVTTLPTDECDRLRSLNSSLWLFMNLNSNHTTGLGIQCLDHAPDFTATAAIRAAVLTGMAILSFVGNVATIASIHRNKTSRRYAAHSYSAVYALIMQLSIADLLVTLFCLAGEAGWSFTVAWLWGNLACKVFKFLQMASLYLSTFVLVLIGLDRFIVVRYPMKALSTTSRCNRLVAVVWILSFVLSTPQLMIFHVEKGPFYEEFHQCVTYGFYTELWQEQVYTTFSLICMFIIPLLILISTYVATITTIARSEQVFRAEVASTDVKHQSTDLNRRRLIHRAKMKSLQISVVIVMAFIVCWTPYYTMMLIFMFLNPDKHMSEDLQSGIFFFGMSNSLINPLIYGAFHLWRPRHGRQNSSYRYRNGSLINRSIASNNSVLSPIRGGSIKNTAAVNSTGTQTALQEETSFCLLPEVQPPRSRNNKLACKFIRHYKGVIHLSGTNAQPHNI